MMVKRKCLTKKVRLAIRKKQGECCGKCGCHLHPRGFHIDHKMPLWCGGSNDPDNLWALCIPCHSRKTSRENRTLKTGAIRLTKFEQQALGAKSAWIHKDIYAKPIGKSYRI